MSFARNLVFVVAGIVVWGSLPALVDLIVRRLP